MLNVNLMHTVARVGRRRAGARGPRHRPRGGRRAARRAAEIMGHGSFSAGNADDFYVDPDSIPEGWTYEWKRRMLMGQEDRSHMVALYRDGWEPVPLHRAGAGGQGSRPDVQIGRAHV